jgi:hypothetical protein
MVQCAVDMYASVAPMGADCEFTESGDRLLEECVTQCDENYDHVLTGVAESADECLSCIDDELNGVCTSTQWTDAATDWCERECNENALNFYGGVLSSWDPVDCT